MAAPAKIHSEALLAALPGTCDEVAARIGMATTTTHRWLHILESQKLCHVARLINTTGRSKRYWELGPGNGDVPKKEARAALPAIKLYVSKPKAPVVVRVRRDPLVAAFFGPAP